MIKFFIMLLICNGLFAEDKQNTDKTEKTKDLPVVSVDSVNTDEFKDPFSKEEKPVTEDDVSFPEDPMTNFWDDDADTQEEAMTRFYSYGRFVHVMGFGELSVPVGARADVYNPGMVIGGRFSYFLDWNLAIILSLGLGFIPIDIITDTGELTGTSNVFDMYIGLKYYLNFYDISTAITLLNPYIVVAGGLYAIQDKFDVADMTVGVTPPSVDSYSGMGSDLYVALGMEFYIFRKDILLGFEMGYKLLIMPDTVTKVIDYSGDAVNMSVNLIWDM